MRARLNARARFVLAGVICSFSLACGSSEEAGEACEAPAPAPDAFEPISGPGGPKLRFDEVPSPSPCAFLSGGEEDIHHHNSVFMLDGYLMMVWAPEWSGGGISSFDFSNPCAPKRVSSLGKFYIRETHAVGLSKHLASAKGSGRWMAVSHLKGISFWDLADVNQPVLGVDFELPGQFYPDAYARVVLSLFWQAPYVYVAGADNGLYIVDATDPRNPELVNTYQFDVPMRAGAVFAVGNLLAVSAAEGTRTVLLDISQPDTPKPILGGTFEVTDEQGVPRDVYHSHLNGDKMWYARKGGGGGLIIYDIADPRAPKYLGGNSPEGSNGGYVFVKDNRAFVGNSNFGNIFDVSDPADVRLEHTFYLEDELGLITSPGDFDTLTPIGNVVVGASDENNKRDEYPKGDLLGRASQVFGVDAEPDSQGPVVTMVNPAAGSQGVPRSSRVGITLSEFVELGSIFPGSFQVVKQGCNSPIEGYYSGQEGIVNFWPKRPLAPNTTYEVIVPEGGIIDYNGNPVRKAFRSSFTTGG